MSFCDEKFFDCFVDSANLVFGDFGQSADFFERSWDIGFSTGDEDASCDDTLNGFALELFRVFDFLVELFCNVGDDFGETDSFAHGTDFFVCGDEVTFGFCGCVLGLCSTEFFGSTRVSVSSGDDGIELRPVQEGVGDSTDTRWIVAILVVSKRPPFRSCIYYPITKNKS